uniref:Uncharacterized protein n=1 Tax=uncultured bacterium contig00132 TaxID=1181581 RepID=A0A806JZU8_9BACT|nr:hypothetical protein [uncultured bacterium contig00132]
MPLAARVSDTYVFPNGSGVIASGSSNVLIGKMPAAAVGDSIAQGSGTVFINKKPAGRMGDSTLNGGKVTSGCGSVSIGG